ncbi:MAG: hypothetical protein DLM71_03110 [Chloroflexi bacterium]|nr:MAG: hypothetical protein DLM71_03110 [Chloroflexota bacterium]
MAAFLIETSAEKPSGPMPRSAEPRYRRRVVLELTPDESEVLDRLAEQHGTIRGAVLVGLRELEVKRSAELEAQARDLADRLATTQQAAQVDHDRTAAELAALTEQLVASRAALKAVKAEAREARADLRAAKATLSAQTSARKTAETARQAAQARLVRHAYCAACDKLVPEAAWAEQPWRNGYATYHKEHGFREKGSFLGQPASLLFWRGRGIEGGHQ